VLGNRKKCEAACKEALLAGRNVVIDRVNFNEPQRAVWVHLGRAVCGSALQLIVLQLVVPIDVCKQRMREEARRAAGGGTPKDTDHLVDRWARLGGGKGKVGGQGRGARWAAAGRGAARRRRSCSPRTSPFGPQPRPPPASSPCPPPPNAPAAPAASPPT
jgi:hypothetical protein